MKETSYSYQTLILQATQKNKSEFCPSNHVSAAAMTSVSDEKWRLFNYVFQSGRAKGLSAPYISSAVNSLDKENVVALIKFIDIKLYFTRNIIISHVNNCPIRCDYIVLLYFLQTVLHVSDDTLIHHQEHTHIVITSGTGRNVFATVQNDSSDSSTTAYGSTSTRCCNCSLSVLLMMDEGITRNM